MAGHELVFIATVSFESNSGNKTKDDVITSENNKSETLTFIDNSPGIDTAISDTTIKRKNGSGEAIVRAAANQTLVDKINYRQLKSGKTYTVKAWLVDAATGAKIEGTDISESKTATTSTTSNLVSGSWDINFKLDTSKLAGKKLVSFVEVYDGGTLVYDHKDQSDVQETVIIPEVKTQLKSQDTNHNTNTGGASTFIDTVNYTNLLPNTSYKIITKFMDAATGAVAKDANGKNMISEQSPFVTGDSPNGSFEVKVKFNLPSNSSVYAAFEEIYIEVGEEGSGNWVPVAAHQDLTDDNQKTVTTTGNTYAKDVKTDTNVSFAEQFVEITDTIHYENLIPNQKYLIRSSLINKETGTVIYDDSGVEQEKEMTFVAEENIEAGRYVANKPYQGDDYSDTKGEVEGVVKPDGTFEGEFEGTITYTKPGYAYGDILPGNHIDGGVIFKVDASELEGYTVVVYEEIYQINDDGSMTLIMSETDPNNEQQSIHFPKIRTNAIDKDTKTSIAMSGDGTSVIVDTISYENVIPGLTYEIQGRVIDRKKTLETGSEVVATGTDGKPAKNSVTITPTSSNGTVDLSFDIDTAKYADDLKTYKGAVFVVYEEMYVVQRYDGDDARSIVAEHTNIDDENQTIYIPYMTTELLDSKTG